MSGDAHAALNFLLLNALLTITTGQHLPIVSSTWASIGCFSSSSVYRKYLPNFGNLLHHNLQPDRMSILLLWRNSNGKIEIKEIFFFFGYNWKWFFITHLPSHQSQNCVLHTASKKKVVVNWNLRFAALMDEHC